jgi:L-fuculose-phosphate aldolase
MSVLSPWIGGTRRLVGHVGQSGLLFGPIRRAIVEPAAPAHDEAVRLMLCYHGKRAWQAGLIAGSCGNLSARTRDRRYIYITPRGANKARLHASEIQIADLEAPVASLTRVSIEFPLHRACYLADAGVGAVIHTHAPELTALGIREIELEEVLPVAAAALGRVVRIPYYPEGSTELAEAAGAAVADGARLLLLARHGVVAIGRNLTEAFERTEFGELSAKTALLAAG